MMQRQGKQSADEWTPAIARKIATLTAWMDKVGLLVDVMEQTFPCWRNSRMAVGQREGSLYGFVDETLVGFSEGSWREHGIGIPQKEM
jgi:hypothetical protein